MTAAGARTVAGRSTRRAQRAVWAVDVQGMRGLVCLLITCWTTTALAAPPAAPYTAPLQLRGAVAGNAVRSETTLGFADNGGAVASYLSASFRFLPDLAGVVRVGMASAAPEVGSAPVALMNPQLGVLWSPKLGESFRLSPFLAVTLPVGMGGGEDPDAGVLASLAAARQARFALDGAIALPNHLWVAGGLSAAWIAHGLTVQAELTLVEGIQVRGPAAADDTMTNSLGGLFVGYALLPVLSVGAELRYQRFLSTPASVVKDPDARDQLSVAAGARGHIVLDGVTVRPGVSYARALGGVGGRLDTQALVFDLGFAL